MSSQPKDPDPFPDLAPPDGTTILSDDDGSSSGYTDASESDFDGPLDDDDDDDDEDIGDLDGLAGNDGNNINNTTSSSSPRIKYLSTLGSSSTLLPPSSSTTHLASFAGSNPSFPGSFNSLASLAPSTNANNTNSTSSPPPHSHSHSHSHTHSQNEALLPPFYNRPPTPVPPSPSFTNLILPTTSSTAPTTPYASDEDVAAPISPTSPKVPTYEYYGFVLHLFSSFAFLIYLLWSFLPSPFLHTMGIYYYPNRWWSLAIPSFVVMGVVYVYVALARFNVEVLTMPLESVETIVDSSAGVAVVDARGRLVRGKGEGGRPRRPGTSHGTGGAAGAAVGAAGSAVFAHGHGHGHGGGGGGGGGSGGGGGGGAGYDGGGMRMQGGGDTGLEAWCVGTDAVLDIPLAGVCEMLYANRDWSVRAGENGRCAS
ncbi:hypothetical protein MKZ38_009928 [Zalerion maritima]|uniref:PIG-P domain-containing protein n=1 Tax=Zalerion maritima TaxID=339359 RepID=A0AAD5RTS6_9PEZI|nr:hypothetical protein MKZ38_009928 [Zalerion maritima]